jgi:hypothetical protein
MARLGPGSYLAGKITDSKLVHYHGDRVIVHEFPNELDRGVTAIAHSPRLGTVVGAGNGGLFRFTPETGRLEALGESGFEVDINAILPVPRGLLLAGRNGFFGLYRKERGACGDARVR